WPHDLETPWVQARLHGTLRQSTFPLYSPQPSPPTPSPGPRKAEPPVISQGLRRRLGLDTGTGAGRGWGGGEPAAGPSAAALSAYTITRSVQLCRLDFHAVSRSRRPRPSA